MIISIIIPCYNNEENLDDLFKRVKTTSENILFKKHHFQIVFVDDGSTDNTYLKQLEIKKQFDCFSFVVVKLTRNFGSYNAFLAGMAHSTGSCNVYLHADLQDPPELICDMFSYYLKGNQLIIANRINRADKNVFSTIYHYLVRKFALKNIPEGGFDLIMFNNEIKTEILTINEKNTNIVYLISYFDFNY
jgi:dolichol-phosphate mannosyltransferase